MMILKDLKYMSIIFAGYCKPEQAKEWQAKLRQAEANTE